jgi:hypothetical protein
MSWCFTLAILYFGMGVPSQFRRWLSFILNASALAMLTMSLGLYLLYCWVVGDIGAEPNPFPKPWLAVVVGFGASCVFVLICAAPMLVILGRIRRLCRNTGLGSGV